MLAALDAETAADTLEAVEPDFQAHLLEAVPDGVAGIINLAARAGVRRARIGR